MIRNNPLYEDLSLKSAKINVCTLSVDLQYIISKECQSLSEEERNKID